MVCSSSPKLVSSEPDVAGLTTRVPAIVCVDVQPGLVASTSKLYVVGTRIVTDGVPDIVNNAGETVNSGTMVIPVPSVSINTENGPTEAARIVSIGVANAAEYLGLESMLVARALPI